MIDSIIGGNQLGEIALQAVTIVAPISSVITFAMALIAPGSGILYGKYNGEFNQNYAYKIAGQSVLGAIIIGPSLALLLFIAKNPYLAYYDCTGELLENASIYYNYMIVLALVGPLSSALYYLNLAEGDAFAILIGMVVNISVNVILSYVLCVRFGIAGLGIATIASKVASTLVYCTHFLKKTNSVKFKWYINFKDIKQATVLSANKSLNYIFIAIVDLVMNKVIIDTCGDTYIAAYSVINLILYLFMIPNATFDSCVGITTSFNGEKNNYGIKNILKTGIKNDVIIAMVIMVLIFLGGEFITNVYGLTSPEIIDASVLSAKILAISAVPFGMAYFGFNIYVCFEKPGLSIVLSFLMNLFCPLIFSIPLAYFWGYTGVSVGMSLSSFLVLLIFVPYVRSRYGKEGFPLYLEDTGEEAVSFDLCVTKATIPEIRDKVKTEFSKRGYEVKQLEILVEELYTRIHEKNPGKKVLSECALLFGDNHVRIIVRDNGTIFNFVDENNKVESLNAHVLNSLLEQTKNKDYTITTSFNRNGFIFEK